MTGLEDVRRRLGIPTHRLELVGPGLMASCSCGTTAVGRTQLEAARLIQDHAQLGITGQLVIEAPHDLDDGLADAVMAWWSYCPLPGVTVTVT